MRLHTFPFAVKNAVPESLSVLGLRQRLYPVFRLRTEQLRTADAWKAPTCFPTPLRHRGNGGNGAFHQSWRVPWICAAWFSGAAEDGIRAVAMFRGRGRDDRTNPENGRNSPGDVLPPGGNIERRMKELWFFPVRPGLRLPVRHTALREESAVQFLRRISSPVFCAWRDNTGEEDFGSAGLVRDIRRWGCHFLFGEWPAWLRLPGCLRLSTVPVILPPHWKDPDIPECRGLSNPQRDGSAMRNGSVNLL